MAVSLWHAAEGDEHQVIAGRHQVSSHSQTHPSFSVVGLRNAVNIYSSKTQPPKDETRKCVCLILRRLACDLREEQCASVAAFGLGVETLSLTNYSAPVAFSTDGRLLAANSQGGIRVVDSSTGKLIAEIPNSMPPFAFSPNGNVIAVDTREAFFSGI